MDAPGDERRQVAILHWAGLRLLVTGAPLRTHDAPGPESRRITLLGGSVRPIRAITEGIARQVGMWEGWAVRWRGAVCRVR